MEQLKQLQKSNVQTETLKNKVLSYTNEPLLKRLSYDLNLTNEEANIAFTELKKFLFICGTNKERLTPSLVIDDIWHQFVLFTKSYIDFCEENFGRVIHHLPDWEFSDESKNKNLKCYIRTCELIGSEFGELNPNFWKNPNLLNAAKCSGDDTGTTGCNSNCANCGECSANDPFSS